MKIFSRKGRRKSKKPGAQSTADTEPKTIAITRPVGKGEDTAEIVRSIGWIPFIFHTVELRPLDGQNIREQMRSSLTEGAIDWMVFMSSRGVNLLFDNLAYEDKVDRNLRGTNFLAVGPRTRDALIRRDLENVFVPGRYSSNGIDEFFSRMNPESIRVALIRSSSADDSLEKSLEKRGASVTTINVYESSVPTDPGTAFAFLEALSKGLFYAILFTSAVSVSNLFEIAKPKLIESDLIKLLKSARIGAIGPSTAQEMRKRGIESIVPDEYLIESAVRKLTDKPGNLEPQPVAS